MHHVFALSRKISLADVNQLTPKQNPLTVFSKIHEFTVSKAAQLFASCTIVMFEV